MAKRYGKLPSEVLAVGSSIDIFASEFAVGYENYVRDKQEKGHTVTPNHSQAELQAMIDSVKKNKKKGK